LKTVDVTSREVGGIAYDVEVAELIGGGNLKILSRAGSADDDYVADRKIASLFLPQLLFFGDPHGI
jgi:hypothetical protein